MLGGHIFFLRFDISELAFLPISLRVELLPLASFLLQLLLDILRPQLHGSRGGWQRRWWRWYWRRERRQRGSRRQNLPLPSPHHHCSTLLPAHHRFVRELLLLLIRCTPEILASSSPSRVVTSSPALTISPVCLGRRSINSFCRLISELIAGGWLGVTGVPGRFPVFHFAKPADAG